MFARGFVVWFCGGFWCIGSFLTGSLLVFCRLWIWWWYCGFVLLWLGIVRGFGWVEFGLLGLWVGFLDGFVLCGIDAIQLLWVVWLCCS